MSSEPGMSLKKEKKAFKIINWREALKEATLDPAVNIKIAFLGGDDTMMMGVTELQPGTKINAHVHGQDVELYHILKGEGEIYIGAQEGESVRWNDPVRVKDGDVFGINPGMVHQLKNTSDHQPLVLIFSTPMSHLKGDRVVTSDYVSP
ncbi:MAG: cupin domain-containing protein [Alphaproteobacteria bacterium]|jgi:mannose-6-phosphate isomerase-like protein (cupin superfamily)|nr:cupin domain-containing protein [Alphaproteobacteria bacterium]